MTRTIARIARVTLVVAAMAVTLCALRGTAAAQQMPDSTTQVTALARDARTPGDHARVAKAYRLQAESFDATAAEHESHVERLTRRQPAFAHKWPALMSGDIAKAKRQAMDARRAARENRQLADRHVRLAVEAQAEAAVN